MALFIDKLIISKTGISNDKALNFSNSLNVIYGDSDSGKTFTVRSLLDTLINIFNNDSFLPNDTLTNTYLNITLTFKNNHFKIIRTDVSDIKVFLIKKNNEIELIKKENDKITINEYEEASDFIKFLKICTTIFCSTASYSSSPFDNYKDNFDFNTIAKFLTKDSTGYYEILESISNDHLSNKNNFISETIENYESNIRSIDKNIQISELKKQKSGKLSSELLAHKNDLKIINLKLKSLFDKMDLLKKLKIQFSNLLMMENDSQKIFQDIESEKNKLNSINDFAGDLNKTFPRYTKLNSLQRDNFERIQLKYHSIKDLDNIIEKQKLKNLKVSNIFKKSTFFILLISSLLTLSFYLKIISFTPWNSFFISCALIWSTTIFLIMIAIVNYYKFKANNPIHDLIKQKNETTNNFFNLLKENDLEVKDLSTDEIYEFLLQYFEEYGFYTEQENELLKMKEDLSPQSEIGNKKKQLKQIENEIKKLKKVIKSSINDIELFEEYDVSEYPVNDAERIINEQIIEFNEEKSKIEELISQINKEIEIEPIHDKQEDFSEIKEKEISKLQLLKKFQKAAIFIEESIESTLSQWKENMLTELTRETLSIFNTITSDQYTNKYDEKAIENYFSNNIFPETENTSVNKILEISSKISISNYLEEQNINIPLILDEPTIYLDKNRLHNLKNILSEYSKKRQIIILTHDTNAFKKFGKRINL